MLSRGRADVCTHSNEQVFRLICACAYAPANVPMMEK